MDRLQRRDDPAGRGPSPSTIQPAAAAGAEISNFDASSPIVARVHVARGNVVAGQPLQSPAQPPAQQYAFQPAPPAQPYAAWQAGIPGPAPAAGGWEDPELAALHQQIQNVHVGPGFGPGPAAALAPQQQQQQQQLELRVRQLETNFRQQLQGLEARFVRQLQTAEARVRQLETKQQGGLQGPCTGCDQRIQHLESELRRVERAARDESQQQIRALEAQLQEVADDKQRFVQEMRRTLQRQLKEAQDRAADLQRQVDQLRGRPNAAPVRPEPAIIRPPEPDPVWPNRPNPAPVHDFRPPPPPPPIAKPFKCFMELPDGRPCPESFDEDVLLESHVQSHFAQEGPPDRGQAPNRPPPAPARPSAPPAPAAPAPPRPAPSNSERIELNFRGNVNGQSVAAQVACQRNELVVDVLQRARQALNCQTALKPQNLIQVIEAGRPQPQKVTRMKAPNATIADAELQGGSDVVVAMGGL